MDDVKNCLKELTTRISEYDFVFRQVKNQLEQNPVILSLPKSSELALDAKQFGGLLMAKLKQIAPSAFCADSLGPGESAELLYAFMKLVQARKLPAVLLPDNQSFEELEEICRKHQHELLIPAFQNYLSALVGLAIFQKEMIR